MRSATFPSTVHELPHRPARRAAAWLVVAALARSPAVADSIHLDFDSAVHTDGDEVVVTADDGEARITAAGTLTVDGRRVRLAAREQRDLARYNALVHSVEATALDLGLEGAGLAAVAVAEAFAAVLTGDGTGAERRIEGRADELEAKARELCDDLRRLERIQDRLASSLPAFRPFAVVELDEDDCQVDD